MTRTSRSAALAAGVLMAWGTHANAQTASTVADGHWHFGDSPYGWLAGLNGRVGVGSVDARVDLSFGDLLKALRFALMSSSEVRKAPLVFGLDGIYISTRESKAVAIRGDTGGLELSQRLSMLQPTAGYTILQKNWSADFLVGMRYWRLSSDLDVDRERRPSNKRSRSRSWADATGGLRIHWVPMPKIRIMAGGDGGGGGAKGTWQAAGTAGYDFASRWTGGLGYRALGVDYDNDNFLFDVTIKGALLYVSYRF